MGRKRDRHISPGSSRHPRLPSTTSRHGAWQHQPLPRAGLTRLCSSWKPSGGVSSVARVFPCQRRLTLPKERACVPGGARRALEKGFLRTAWLWDGSGACRTQAWMGAGGVCAARRGGGGGCGELLGAGVTRGGGGMMLSRCGGWLWGFRGVQVCWFDCPPSHGKVGLGALVPLVKE